MRNNNIDFISYTIESYFMITIDGKVSAWLYSISEIWSNGMMDI